LARNKNLDGKTRKKHAKRPVVAAAGLILFLVGFMLTGCARFPSPPSRASGAQRAGPAGGEPVPFDAEVRRGRLKNGMSYYIRENKKPEGRLQLRLAVDAGSILEEENERGLAHFIEHMAFNGTEAYDKNSLVDYLESIGMSFGPDINAYTSFDETVYSLDLPVDDPEIVKRGLGILKEWAFHIRFDLQEIEKERGVIVEEWRSGRGASARLRERWWPVLAGDAKYAERLPIGLMKVVEEAPRGRFLAFYDRWYRPELMAVVLVGDIDPEKMEALLIEIFSEEDADPQRMQEKTERPKFEIPEPKEDRSVVATDLEAGSVSIRIFALSDRREIRTKDEYREALALSLYGRMISRRLREAARGEDPPFIQGYFSRGPLVRGKTASVYAALAYEGDIEEGIRRLLMEERRADLYGFSETELERAKKELSSAMEKAYNERDKTESSIYAREYVRHFLAGEVSPGREWEWRTLQEVLPAIDVEMIERLHRDRVKRDHRVIVVTGPEKKGLRYPAEEEIGRIVEEVSKAEIAPYRDDFTGDSLLGEMPEGGAVISRDYFQRGDYHRMELENGARIIYKKTELKNDEIRFSAFSEGGYSLLETEDIHRAKYAPNFIDACGLGGFSPVQLEKLLAGRNVDLRPYIGRYREGFSGGSRPEDLELLFQLLYLYFTDLREDEALFRAYRKRFASAIQNRRKNPQIVYRDELTRLLFDGNERTLALNADEVRDMEIKEVFRLFRERFAGPGDFTFFFVGNIEEEKIEEFASRYLGALAGGNGKVKKQETWRDNGVGFTGESAKARVFAGSEEKSRVTLVYTENYDWGLEQNHELVSLVDLLNIRLREAVREDAGGSYGVGVSSAANKYPQQEYALWISFSCKPERVEELVAVVERELSAVIGGAVFEDEALKVREKQKSELDRERQENSYWLGLLAAAHRFDLPVSRLHEKEKRIERVTAPLLGRAAKEYLDGAVRLELVMMPEDRSGGAVGEKD
jgi:zinc protease